MGEAGGWVTEFFFENIAHEFARAEINGGKNNDTQKSAGRAVERKECEPAPIADNLRGVQKIQPNLGREKIKRDFNAEMSPVILRNFPPEIFSYRALATQEGYESEHFVNQVPTAVTHTNHHIHFAFDHWRHQFGDGFRREPFNVRVGEKNNFALRQSNTTVHRITLAQISRVAHDLYIKFLRHRAGAVGRTIVHYDYFPEMRIGG